MVKKATANVAFDLMLKRSAKRLRRYKSRLRDHHSKEKSEAKQNPPSAQKYFIVSPADEGESDQDSGLNERGDNPVIIAETTALFETMSVSEAFMRLDLTDWSAMVFLNAGYGWVNVVHSRSDENIGWINPEKAMIAA